MLERLSDQAVRATELARAEARALGHGHVGTEHLLLGILAEGDNPAADALLASGATLFGCRQIAAEAIGNDSPPRASGEPLYTERANRALERASRLALRRRDPAVETTHILGSVLDVEGRAGQVLRGLGVDPTRVHQTLEASLATASPDSVARSADSGSAAGPRASESDTTDSAPLCGNCGASLEGSLAQRVINVQGATAPRGAWLVAYCATCGSAVGARAAVSEI
jgi:ATP-dependent Clp protease ATP-binding subunit ClpA